VVCRGKAARLSPNADLRLLPALLGLVVLEADDTEDEEGEVPHEDLDEASLASELHSAGTSSVTDCLADIWILTKKK